MSNTCLILEISTISSKSLLLANNTIGTSGGSNSAGGWSLSP
ncbi:MAG: hypothetical protein WBH31_09950 [Promethearchaeia archaeon]